MCHVAHIQRVCLGFVNVVGERFRIPPAQEDPGTQWVGYSNCVQAWFSRGLSGRKGRNPKTQREAPSLGDTPAGIRRIVAQSKVEPASAGNGGFVGRECFLLLGADREIYQLDAPSTK